MALPLAEPERMGRKKYDKSSPLNFGSKGEDQSDIDSEILSYQFNN